MLTLAFFSVLAVGPIVSLIITIAILGVLVWALTSWIPLSEPFRRAIFIIATIVLVVLLLKFVIEYLGPYLNF